MLMKKLITLLILFVGMVSSVNADNVTKRIFVKTDANFQTYQGAGLAVHAWYTDNSGDIYTINDDNEKMAIIADFNPTKKAGLWFKDITFDASKTIKFFVYQKGNENWHSSNGTQQQLNASSGINYYSWNSTNNGDLTLVGPVTYYAYMYDGTSEWTQQALTSTDNVAFTTSIDNETSYNSNLEFIIAPSFAFDSDFSSNKWDLMYRPFGENRYVNFSNQTNYGGGSWASNSNSLKLNAAATYDLTFYPFSWTYSLAPHFTRNISAGYATFSFAYNVAIPNDVTAWYAKEVQEVSAGNNRIVMKKFTNGIPANTGALLEGSGDITFTPAASTTAPGTNLLVATVTETPIAVSTPGAYHYILGNGTAGVGFYNVNEERNSAAGKAYLETATELATENANARVAWIFDEEGETTGIAAVKASQKMNGEFFNLAGQRVAQPTKGLYIVNGKKVIMK